MLACIEIVEPLSFDFRFQDFRGFCFEDFNLEELSNHQSQTGEIKRVDGDRLFLCIESHFCEI